MPSSLDCVLCLLRQSLDSARFATIDENIHKEALFSAMEIVKKRGFDIIPPIIGQEIHREIRRLTKSSDPYAAVKKEFNAEMLNRLPSLRQEINGSFETALKIAIGGNAIDFALGSHLNADYLDNALADALAKPLNGSPDDFVQILKSSQNILYLADNCGEIACDRLLVEFILQTFPNVNLTLAVRGAPIINDATREDAVFVGFDKIVPIIDNGNDGMGTMLEQCSEEFLKHFNKADLIISKGLGNYETLIEFAENNKKQTFAFLFKTKCAFIAKFSETQLGDHVIKLV